MTYKAWSGASVLVFGALDFEFVWDFVFRASDFGDKVTQRRQSERASWVAVVKYN
jgi:hypothetical protein